MLPNLPAIETHAGRIAIGATVRSTRYRDVQGLVTAIYWNGYHYAIKVNDRHSDDAGQYELLSENTHQGFNCVNSHTQQVLSGQFEVLLPGEGDRIYFADTAEQAIALLAATIGLRDQDAEVEYLKQRAEAGPVDELRWRGQAVGSLVGQLAYVSTGKQHPAPKFLVGHQVHFFSPHTTHTISGLAIYKDRLNYGKTQWHYSYEVAQGIHHPMSEAHTTAAQQSAARLEQPAEVPTSAEVAASTATPPDAAPAEPVQFSEAMQAIIASQVATVQDVAQQSPQIRPSC